jgi:apolipoprotein N-acyltransferase
MVLARIFGGFPWDLLGVSQYRLVPLIQVASVTGVYGVSFLVVWVSLAFVSAGLMVIRRPVTRSVWVGELFLPLITVALLFAQGLRCVTAQPKAERAVNVTFIQPSIPQTTIWDPDSDTNRFRELVAYTEKVLTNETDILIWPESAVPKMVRYDQDTFDAISGLAQRHRMWMIIGSDDAEPRGEDPKAGIDYFNSSFLVSPEGQLVERYRKRSLVIFGEYVPLERWLPFLHWFTPVQGGFTPGTGPMPFRLGQLRITTSVLICFEDIFPQLGRAGEEADIDFLVNITNDGWFGHSAAQWQHAATALFRAVENRVPLLRCCNNGVSCWIDAQGRLRQILRDDAGTVYGKGAMTVRIELPEKGTRPVTYYRRHGDVFGWTCTAIAAAVMLVVIGNAIRRRRPKQTQP